ncbi:hypothetical protein [Oceanirhabdus sp. W0125-5]|uniref:hypothetical protein n=1 Tax=Oceanirhabdus sp. W0125-5 TaxID=2999116 RepID=UPI0022F2D84B|nr:hypothetical protein [Oceanirhabdus sp. W0125-5]WBW98370.1 hypothetical protein OW730_06270 [Oceanirhabdus sp. W0125-5]
MKGNFESKFKYWVRQVITDKAISKDILAINFGLFESDNGFSIYAIGSSEYDEEDFDWACNEDYVPSSKYLIVDDERLNQMDWNIFNDYIIDKLREFLKEESLNIRESINVITTGFDDGDLDVVWRKI